MKTPTGEGALQMDAMMARGVSGLSALARDMSCASLDQSGLDFSRLTSLDLGEIALGGGGFESQAATTSQEHPLQGGEVAAAAGASAPAFGSVPPRAASITRVMSAPARDRSVRSIASMGVGSVASGSTSFLDSSIIDAGTIAQGNGEGMLGTVTAGVAPAFSLATMPLASAPERLTRASTTNVTPVVRLLTTPAVGRQGSNGIGPVLPIAPGLAPTGPAAAIVAAGNATRVGLGVSVGTAVAITPAPAPGVALTPAAPVPAPVPAPVTRRRSRACVNARKHTDAALHAGVAPTAAPTSTGSRRNRSRLLSSSDSCGSSYGSGTNSDSGADAGVPSNSKPLPRRKAKKRRRASSKGSAAAAAQAEADAAELFGLTGEERAKRRRELRLRRNRESAFRSRLRRKAQNEQMISELKQLRVTSDDQRKDIVALRAHATLLNTEVRRLRNVLRARGADESEIGERLPAMPALISGAVADADVAASAVTTASTYPTVDDVDMHTAQAGATRATAGRTGVMAMTLVFALAMFLVNGSEQLHLGSRPGMGVLGGGVVAGAGVGTAAHRGRVLHMFNDLASGAAAHLTNTGAAVAAAASQAAASQAAAEASALATATATKVTSSTTVANAAAKAIGATTAEAPMNGAPMPRLWSPSAFVTTGLYVAGVPHLAEIALGLFAAMAIVFAAALYLFAKWSAGVTFLQPTYYADNGSELPTAVPAKHRRRVQCDKGDKAGRRRSRRVRVSTSGKVATPTRATGFPTAISEAANRAAAAAERDHTSIGEDFRRIQEWYRAVCAGAEVAVAPPLSRAASTSDLPAIASTAPVAVATPVVPRGVGAVVATNEVPRPRSVSQSGTHRLGLDGSAWESLMCSSNDSRSSVGFPVGCGSSQQPGYAAAFPAPRSVYVY